MPVNKTALFKDTRFTREELFSHYSMFLLTSLFLAIFQRSLRNKNLQDTIFSTSVNAILENLKIHMALE